MHVLYVMKCYIQTVLYIHCRKATVGPTKDDVNLRSTSNSKQCRYVTVCDQTGIITRGTQICGLHWRTVIILHVSAPQNTGCICIQCDKTSSILNFCLCGCWGGGGTGGSVAGARQASGGGLTEECLTQPQPLSLFSTTTVCLQDST